MSCAWKVSIFLKFFDNYKPFVVSRYPRSKICRYLMFLLSSFYNWKYHTNTSNHIILKLQIDFVVLY